MYKPFHVVFHELIDWVHDILICLGKAMQIWKPGKTIFHKSQFSIIIWSRAEGGIFGEQGIQNIFSADIFFLPQLVWLHFIR